MANSIYIAQPIPSILLDAMPSAGADGLVEIPIAVTGTWKRGETEFSISRQDLARMAANFKRRKNGEINVDYDHASEMPEVAKGGPVPSAGRILKLRSNGALYATLEFTARALEMIKAGEYRFVSPAIAWGLKSKVTGEDEGAVLTSLALTNRPFLEELPPIRLSEIGEQISNRSEAMPDSTVDRRNSRELIKLANARAKENGLPFATALAEVGRENVELAQAARQEVLGIKLRYKSVGNEQVPNQQMVIIDDQPAVDLSWIVAQLAKERAKEKGVNANLSEALNEILRENPGLARRYREQLLVE